jgi:hypothetical protein
MVGYERHGMVAIAVAYAFKILIAIAFTVLASME